MIRSARLLRIATIVVCALALTGSRAACQEPSHPIADAVPRPPALIPLYASFATLQLVDMHSTRRALNRGAVEANPLLSGVAGNKAMLLTVKAAGTAGVIAVSERLRKKSRTAAVMLMISVNSGMMWVVEHNYTAVR
jgi:hypothetical protein